MYCNASTALYKNVPLALLLKPDLKALFDFLAAILSKVAEWKAHKEALLSGDVTQGMEPAEEVDIYAVKETVSNNPCTL